MNRQAILFTLAFVALAGAGHAQQRGQSREDLLDALTHYVAFSEDGFRHQRVAGQRIRRDYFEPITAEGVDRFMHVTPNGRMGDV